ncbi:phytochelatin synthase family protein [Shewanella waksmanii]|uniref:phytochelatin synthase family protein n=1 Tax=Shewanella waksmanii TaxID=213783 RepID=UPI003736F1D5
MHHFAIRLRHTMLAMLKGLIVALPLILLNSANANTLIGWQSEQSQQRFQTSQFKQDFFQLTPHFEGQINKVFCGVASLTIVANALNVTPSNTSLPLNQLSAQEPHYHQHTSPNWSPFFHRYNQKNLLKAAQFPARALFGYPEKQRAAGQLGLNLAELQHIATQLHLNVNSVTVRPESQQRPQQYQQLKQQLIDTLAATDQYVIVNYDRASLEQRGAGHFSPLAAYDSHSDSFLIMDVSNTYQTWTWVTSPALFNAMATKDGDHYRGFLTITSG